MPHFNPDVRLSEIVIKEPSIIPVLNRFGITLGTGDMTLRETSDSHRLDPDFLLSIINTYSDDEYFPEQALKSVQVSTIVDYLTKTHNYYTRFQIPNIERHFDALLHTSSDNSNLSLMRRFFESVKKQLLVNIEQDAQQLFPTLLEGKEIDDTGLFSQSPVAELLTDLKNMFIIHLTGNYDLNLAYAVIVAIITLENDIRKNNRIRDRILLGQYKRNDQ